MATRRESELQVITKAKDLCRYVITITQKSPKQFRFTFVTRLQNLSLSIIEHIYRANEVYVQKGPRQEQLIQTRLNLQHKALTDLKLLSYFALLATEEKCILPKQFEQIAKRTTDCQYLLGAWINSDKRRYLP